MNANVKKLLAVGLAGCLTLTVAACGSGGTDKDKAGDKTADSGGDQSLKKVTLILDYTPNTNHTGLYAAKDLGYYKEQGLDVDIVESASDTAASLISVGKGDFGISYQEDVTYALAQDPPMPIKTIATIIQHNTSGFASYKGKNITSPKDFENKTYAGWGAPSEAAVIKAVMQKAGADFNTVKMIDANGVGYELLKDKVDFMWFFWAWDGMMAEDAGVPINYMEVRKLDPRLDFYTPVIITNTNTIAKDPKLVQKFMTATKKGYEYAIANPDDAAKLLHNHATSYDLDFLTRSQEYLSKKYSEDSPVWGVMKDEVWNNYTDFMKEYGLIDKNKDIKASDCYTNQFLE